MMFDTDILIWVQRGNAKAAALLDKDKQPQISVYSYMELLQSAQNKIQHKIIKEFLRDFNFTLIPITEAIGYRASIYVEEYSLSSGIRAGDAIIAATAVENNIKLVSSNVKHFKMVQELDFLAFKP